MIDAKGYRSNVGMIICNDQGQVLWARRIGGANNWQFPQGGINEGETPEQALYRELEEEVGLSQGHVDILAVTRGWLSYKLPKQFIREHQHPLCIGQKQKWFLLKLSASDQEINVSAGAPAEFDDWRWVSYWYPVNQVVDFKRGVYRRALKELSSVHSHLENSQS